MTSSLLRSDAAFGVDNTSSPSIFSRVCELFGLVRKSFADRALRRDLALMDDALLRDIGINDDEIWRVRRLETFVPRNWA